ncbi:MAG: hypothetical protein AAGK78_11270, partial [Planctomycetota bacterium]
MDISSNGYRYTWHEQWAKLPESSASNGTTHGVQVLKDGRVVVFNQASPAVLTYSASGKLLNAFGEYEGAHGLIAREDGGEARLYITDEFNSKVHVLDLEGNVIVDVAPPPAEAQANDLGREKFVPTWMDRGPDGDLWVADGYGTWKVYRYDSEGNYKSCIDGSEGAGRFNEPHGLAFSPRGELWITDRSNLRVTVYDADGNYLRHRDGLFHSPAAFAFHGDHAYVAEIAGGMKIVNHDLELVASLGDNPAITPNTEPGTWCPTENHRQPGWPNVDPTLLHAGHFHTP